MEYLDKVKAQLKKMSLEEKDAWILTQAKLISNYKQNDFLMSLSGTKKIINMPTLDDIDTLCTRIETGDIYLVADVLGHRDVNTTKKHYAAMDDARRRKAATAVHLRED